MSDNLCILQGNPVIWQGIEESDLGLPDEITRPTTLFHSAWVDIKYSTMSASDDF